MRPAPSIAVVGGCGVGLTFVLDRAPDAGETVRAELFRQDPGGKGSNQAIAAARLGARVSLLTAIGDDGFGDQLLELWSTEEVDAAAVRRVPGASTMVGVILVEASGENRIAICGGALDALEAADARRFAPQIAAADVCLISLETPLEVAVEALRIARESGTASVLNPAPAPETQLPAAVWELIDVITPNAGEAAALAGTGGPPQVLAEALRRLGASSVVVTAGENGAFLADGAHEHVPAHAVESVLDSTGAGDAFSAALAVAIGEGLSLVAACQWGCAAGAWSVQHAGVVPGLPTRAELDAALAPAGTTR